jgi:hypothetical protein
VPFSPWDDSPAEADKAATWAPRAKAEAAARRYPNGSQGGIGIELGDLGADSFLCGVDIDTCFADGRFEPWAQAVISQFYSYTEISPGGAGAKIFFLVDQADIPGIRQVMGTEHGREWKRSAQGDHPPGIELYTSNRYFAVTGKHLAETLDSLQRVSADTIKWLINEAGPALVGKKQTGAKDNSRSAKALREGAILKRAGKTYQEMCDGLRNHPDPKIQEWCRESDERQFQRIWAKVSGETIAPADPIDELNQTYAVIRVVNRAAILNEHLDPQGHPTFSLLAPESFRLLLANRKIEIETKDKDGNTIVKPSPIANVWIGHSHRRQFEGITFAPQGAPPGYFNLWSGFALKPSEKGSCERFKQHLLDNVCQDNVALYNWVFGWFADIFKNPAKKCGTSLALRGEMGTGKTIVGKTFGRLLGLHYVPVDDPRYIVGRFNAHLVRCLLLHADEAFWAGDHTAEGKLRGLVTGDQHPIELKGFEVFFVSNYVRLFICGDRDWLVPAGMGERRFATLDVADTHKEDTAYFRAIEEELEDGGYQRLLYELLTFDLETVDLRHIPKTEALLDQKIASLSPEDGWWLDILKHGSLPYHSKDAKPRCCPGKLLYDDYIEHAQKQGARRRQIETAVGIFIDKTVPSLSTAVETFTLRDETAFDKRVDSRGTVYTFPSLAECRKAFAEKIHQSMTWPEVTEWKRDEVCKVCIRFAAKM